jgi:hypothetical protein
MIVIAAVATQTGFVLGYSLALEPAYRRLFLDEILALPQPFLSGAVAAAVFTAALGWRPDKA